MGLQTSTNRYKSVTPQHPNVTLDGFDEIRSTVLVTWFTKATTALVGGVLAASALGGCSGEPKPKPAATTKPAPGTHPTVPATNPLTGLVGAPPGPVIAVKLDDTAPGRPSLGVEKADVIYIEEVEGGLSRMVAVFASAKPRVRAVRSVRPSDPELLGQYGKIIVVATGGGGSSLPALDRSDLRSSINDRGQVGFTRDPSRAAPYNVVSDLAKVSRAIKADGVRDVGFQWAAKDARLARAKSAPKVSTLVGSTPVGFVWDAKEARYVRLVGGQRIRAASGAPVAKPNVLVQYCKVRPDRSDIDVRGNPTMYTESVGKGRAVLFRGGKRIEGKWSRARVGARTNFTDLGGNRLLFAPGGTFVALARPGSPA
ncbi:MAG: hypothetical protein QOF35_1267 [Actinomycetota bacterium]|nr:hypothetical protein [Actinomycetota bacterium]